MIQKNIFALSLLGMCSIAGEALALCPTFADQVTSRFSAGFATGQASNFAGGMYAIDVSLGEGNAPLLNLASGAYPGFVWTSNGRPGFYGPGPVDVYVNYVVGPSASSGMYRYVNLYIYNTAGQTICASSFRVNVP